MTSPPELKTVHQTFMAFMSAMLDDTTEARVINELHNDLTDCLADDVLSVAGGTITTLLEALETATGTPVSELWADLAHNVAANHADD